MLGSRAALNRHYDDGSHPVILSVHHAATLLHGDTARAVRHQAAGTLAALLAGGAGGGALQGGAGGGAGGGAQLVVTSRRTAHSCNSKQQAVFI